MKDLEENIGQLIFWGVAFGTLLALAYLYG